MNQEECKEIKQALELFLNESLERVLMSNPADSGKISRSRIRPLLMKGRLVFQAEEQAGKQAFHRNLDKDEAADYVTGLLEGSFRQAEITSGLGKALILVSKKGKVTVKVKRYPESVRIQPAGEPGSPGSLSHNRKKHYILEEGIPVPFLVDLGVMTKEGRVVNSRYDKYRQINRFLEFIEDILPNLDQGRESAIIDFGCGKSYLTFAMYYYLKELKGYPVRIIGLDLKEDVIEHCSRLGRQYGYDGLSFCHGDIASFEGVEKVDMVVTLHACDLATDYALEKAVNWGARVILSVPCCQHELNGQMENSLLRPVLQYGLIKERMAALYTDAIRAQVLEYRGYRTQILEFIDMEHTPKNILIRAVRQGRKREFPIVKDTTPNMMNPRLYTTSYNKPQGQQFDDTAVLSFIKLQYT
uniref:class I SAM-dependent methyltransferase n=1 Tax=Enterocloster clostridioformis TaxID=1531 RepID=UPI00242D3D05|nr:SAM-dependent methyltransferase [Enterocloster clostridioformis]